MLNAINSTIEGTDGLAAVCCTSKIWLIALPRAGPGCLLLLRPSLRTSTSPRVHRTIRWVGSTIPVRLDGGHGGV